MKPEIKQALGELLLAWADDELILAHRNSEWTGHAPILEEDIAFSNIAQDELGHATLFYGLYQELSGENPDQLVFFRSATAYRNVPLVELPKGDWAFSMLRQFLFDAWEAARLTTLVNSAYQPLADTAVKIRQEEMYHLRHTRLWIQRLGLGTEESHRRLQDALSALWPYAQGLFVPLAGEALLVEAGMVEATAVIHAQWVEAVQTHLQNAGLVVPTAVTPLQTGRNHHTPYLTELLVEMQKVARLDPQAQW